MAGVQEPSVVVRSAARERRWSSDYIAGSDAGKRLPINAFLGLVRQGHSFYRSPARFARLFWAFSTNLGHQFEIFRILALPAFASLVRLDPIFPFKYLTRGYLVRGLAPAERAASFAHHYRRLNAIFPRPLLQKILYRDIVLVEKQIDERLLSVHLNLARKEVREGELTFTLRLDGTAIYILQCTIVPGKVVKSSASDVILVSRLQGMKGSYKQVQLATKAFSEVAPPALLLAVLHGFAQIAGIDEMAGIAAASQFSYLPEYVDSFRAAYDNFWIELGAKKITASFYASPIPPQDKSLDAITNGHKSRTRKKRALKQQIAEHVVRLLRKPDTNPSFIAVPSSSSLPQD